MKALSVVLVGGLLLCPLLLSAKRGAPPKVEAVVYEGIRYTAPNDNGQVVSIEAYDAASGKKLWAKEIFRNKIDPSLEADVQWVFIKALVVRNGNLLIINEKDRKYVLDLKSLSVKSITA